MLKHSHPVLRALLCLLLCFNHPSQALLKHTYPVSSPLCGIQVCFNVWQVLLLPRFGPELRPWRTFRPAIATLRAVFAPTAVPYASSRRPWLRAAPLPVTASPPFLCVQMWRLSG